MNSPPRSATGRGASRFRLSVGTAAAAAATAGGILTYAALPADVVASLLPWRICVVVAVLAVLGAAASCTLSAIGAGAARIGRAALLARTIVVAFAVWVVAGGLEHACTMPLGLQVVAESALAAVCVLTLEAAAWAGDRLAGPADAARRPAAEDAAVAALLLGIALRGDYARFALWSPPVRLYLGALMCAAAGLTALLAMQRGVTPRRWIAAALLVAAAGGLLWFDATMYRRLYVEMHLAAWGVAVFVAARIAESGTATPVSARLRRATGLTAVAALAVAAAASDSLLRAELFGRAGPLGRLARTAGIWLGPVVPPEVAVGYSPQPGSPATPRAAPPCVVLVSVDALRADRLSPAHMPAASEWAPSGLRFVQARTVFPGTHQTFGSILSGRLALDGSAGDTGIVDAFRAAGWRTVAVGNLARHGYVAGRFETIESAGARDDARSAELFVRHLRAAAADTRPLLGWLHLDRTHAPYEPEGPVRGGRPVDRYDACAREVDSILRAVLEEADRLARARPTLTVLFADHGEEFGEHGGEYHLSSLYDEQIRVPLVFRGADVAAGVRDDAVSVIDLGPTLLDAAGLAIPDGLHGRSLHAALRGGVVEARPVRSVLVDMRSGRTMLRSVVLDGWKLIADSVTGTEALFRLRDDPGELRNRIADGGDAPDELFDALSVARPATTDR